MTSNLGKFVTDSPHLRYKGLIQNRLIKGLSKSILFVEDTDQEWNQLLTMGKAKPFNTNSSEGRSKSTPTKYQQEIFIGIGPALKTNSRQSLFYK